MSVPVDTFALFLLVLLRTGGLFVSAPFFSSAAFPWQGKMGMALLLSFILLPGTSGQVPPVSALSLPELAVLAVQELMTGLTIGLAMQVLFSAVRFAGELISVDMGFSMATIFDPENGTPFPVLSELLYLFTLMLFLTVNGHHFMVEAVAMSYGAVPAGSWRVDAAAASSVAALTGKVFAIAVKIAAPLLVSLFLANITLGILNKVMPQMNIFSVLFPLKIGIGLIVLAATVPVVAFVFKKVLSSFEGSVVDLLRTF